MALDSEKLARFNSIGPAGVKREMAEGKHGQAPDSRLWIEASTWVEAEVLRIALESSDLRDSREQRTLAIAEEALSTAREANRIASEDLAIARSSSEHARSNARWAMYAAIVAVIAAAISTKDNILALIFGTP